MRVLVTGAGGNLGGKLRAHLQGRHELILLSHRPQRDAAIHAADLSTWDEDWVRLFRGADVVFHFAANPDPRAAWWDAETIAVLNVLLDEVIDRYQVDRTRIYLTGLSAGGYGSWWLATAYPEKFAAVVSVAGSGYRTAMPPAQEVVCRLQDVPVWAIHGAQDLISEPMANKMQVLALSACGGEVEWTLYPDAGHGEAYARAYRDPALYTWLLEHSLEQ